MSLLNAAETNPLKGGASFSLSNRLTRVAWSLSWLFLARWTPPPLHRWRAFVLRTFGAKIAASARVHASVRVWLPANLELGENVLVGPAANLYNQGQIKIGPYTVISQGAHICASSHDVHDPNFQLILRPVTIGAHCWVAAEAFVGPGVVMADRSVLGGRGALFTDTEVDGIYRGNPAVFVKHRKLRFTE